MSNNLSDIDLIKNKLSEEELLSMSAISALIGLLCTGVLCASGYATMWVINTPLFNLETKTVILAAIVIGAVVAFIEASTCYYKSITRFKDLLYNNNIQTDLLEHFHRIVIATTFAVLVIIIGSAFYVDPSLVSTLVVISAVFSGFYFYIYRKKELTVKKALIYIGLGCVTGIAAYGLGVTITISIGLIGLLLTAGIIVLEVIFTAIFIYIALCEWLEKHRHDITRANERAANDAMAAANAAESEFNAEGSHE